MEARGVSPDSSTHISEKSRKSKKRKHKQKSAKTKHKKVKSSSSESTHHSHKKSKKHKKSSHSPTPSEESDEEILDIKPLSGYIDDKKELHKEIFSLVSKKEVKDLLPPLLKKLKFKEFKSLCLEQLEVMSQKRLRHIIAGQEMVSSSSDESEAHEQQMKQDDDGEPESEKIDAAANEPLEQEDMTVAREHTEDQPQKVSILEEMSLVPDQDEIDELIEPEPQTSCQEPVQPEKKQAGEEKDNPPEAEDQSLMMAEADLRELEFRARALKSLVLARERQQKLQKEKEQKEEPQALQIPKHVKE